MASIFFLILGYEKPSSKKRILCSLDYLRSLGHRIDVMPVPRSLYGRIALLPVLRRADLVVLQKKLFNAWQLRLLQRANRNLIYDLDDAVMFHEMERGEPIRGKYFQRFVRTVEACRGVITGNSYLAEYAHAIGKHCRGEERKTLILPTPVDTISLTPGRREENRERVTIGWLGTKGNLTHLRMIEKPLSHILRDKANTVFKVISDAQPVGLACPFLFKSWSQTRENDDLQSFDIGLMPLNDNLWTRGKGGYKLLQYMAVGAASIASPVGINREIIHHGENGFLAESERQWVEILMELVRDQQLRGHVGKAARETVERTYSLDEFNRRLGDFLESLL